MYVYFFRVKFPACTHPIKYCTFIYFEEFSRLYVFLSSCTFICFRPIHVGKNSHPSEVKCRRAFTVITVELFVGDFECYMYANSNVSLRFERFATFRTFNVRTAIKKIRQFFPCTIILACTFIYFSSDFSPVRLFCSVRLLIPVLFSLLYVYFGLYVYSIPESNYTWSAIELIFLCFF